MSSYATLPQDVIARIPKGRDFFDLTFTAPGAQIEKLAGNLAGGGLQIDGASGAENRFIIDGMDTTSLLDGASGKVMLVDFVQEVQVKSSGYNAEFGGSTGGVVSAITKSGSNQVRGSVGLYEQNNHFAGLVDKRGVHGYSPWNNATTGKQEPLAGLVTQLTPWQDYNPVGEIGGPIARDRVWDHAGLAYLQNTYSIDTWLVGEPGHPVRHFEWGNWALSPNYNAAAQVTRDLRVRVAGSNQRNQSRKAGPGFNPENLVYDGHVAGANCNALALSGLAGKALAGSTGTSAPSWLSVYPACTIDQAKFDGTYVNTGSDSRSDVLSGTVDWVVRPTVFVNATAGLFRTNSWGNPAWSNDVIQRTFSTGNLDANMLSPQFPQANGEPWPLVPAAYQQAAAYSDQTVSSNLLVRNAFTRLYVNANLAWYRSLRGQHAFKAGARFERFGNDAYDGKTKPLVNLNWGRTYTASDGRVVQGRYGFYVLSKVGTIGSAFSNNYAFWLQDSWAVNNKLTINAGVRTEREVVPNFNKAQLPTIEFGFGDKIAPRLGFAYDVHANSKWKVYGSYGLFYDVMKLYTPRADAWHRVRHRPDARHLRLEGHRLRRRHRRATRAPSSSRRRTRAPLHPSTPP